MAMRLPLRGVLLLSLGLLASPAAAQTTITFEEEELQDVGPGEDFTYRGTSWSGGGVITSIGVLEIYHSGFISYMVTDFVGSGFAMVEFDRPATDVSFAYMHLTGGPITPGTATAFDESGAELGRIDSVPGAGLASPLLDFGTEVPISTIEFDGAVVDTISYTLPEPGQGALGLAVLAALAMLRSRRLQDAQG